VAPRDRYVTRPAPKTGYRLRGRGLLWYNRPVLARTGDTTTRWGETVRRTTLWVAALLLLPACSDDSESNPGGLGQPCRPDGSCDPGLTCSAGTCVEDRRGQEGQACRPDGSCDAGLVCSLDKVCINPAGDGGPWPDGGPQPDGGERTFVQLTVGEKHGCALHANGNVACWGDGSYGATTVPAGELFSQVDAGWGHTCGVLAGSATPGQMRCWGNNDAQQANSPPGQYKQVSAGWAFTCAVKQDGTLWCWGNNDVNQTKPPAGSFQQVGTGNMHACAVQGDGKLACWGFDSFGQATPPTYSFSQVSAGSNFACGVRGSGELACWGDDLDGQCTPPAGVFQQVAAGKGFSCGLKQDGAIVCWGLSDKGQTKPPAP
jgi:hypothetical protein